MSSLARLAMASLFRSTDRAHVRRRFRAGAARMNANLVIGAERILRKRKAPGRGADPALSLAEGAMAGPTHAQKKELFRNHYLLGRLDPEEIEALAMRARVERYKAGQEIFAKGSPGRSMIAVLRGSVKIASPSPAGKEIVLNIVHAGEIF